ncbi:MAG TPA: hypothetical protein VFQ61_33360 [Polyangiaceae bacterium]|nr:hypothetical protein [Polyangiaceae bacterium]
MSGRSTPVRHHWLLRACLHLGPFLWVSSATAQQATPPQDGAPVAEPGAEHPQDTPAPSADSPPPAASPSPGPTAPPSVAAPAAPSTAPAPPPAGTPPAGPPASSIPDGEAPAGPIAPAFPPAIPNIDYGARMQAGLKFQNPDHPSRMDDISEVLTADLYMSGQIHRYLKWQVSVTMSYPGTVGSPGTVNVTPHDVIARIEPIPEFNVYLGRMLVVVDRFAPSGPWGMDEFFLPGFFPLVAPPALPKAGASGRDVGVTVWGAPLKGHVKYYLGAFNLYDPALNPLLSGRLQVSLLNGEPAFYHRTTYFGTKDLVSFGVGGQYQKKGSVQTVPVTTPPTPPLTDDYDNVTADLTVEKNIADAGTVSLVGAYYKYGGDFQRWKDFWVASAGYMLPKPLGIGKVRATVRYQRALDNSPGADPTSLVEAQLSYNVAAWFARFQLGYRHGDTYLAPTATTPARSQASNMAYFGVTLADP